MITKRHLTTTLFLSFYMHYIFAPSLQTPPSSQLQTANDEWQNHQKQKCDFVFCPFEIFVPYITLLNKNKTCFAALTPRISTLHAPSTVRPHDAASQNSKCQTLKVGNSKFRNSKSKNQFPIPRLTHFQQFPYQDTSGYSHPFHSYYITALSIRI